MAPFVPLAPLLEDAGIGEAIYALAAEIYPICRSITGDGVRATLARLARHVELEVHEVPTGTRVFDWTVPKEWNVREAWIADPEGGRIVDYAACNLHLLGYSVPVRARMPLAELREHVFTDPARPDVIPYRTSYYDERWGFCMSARQLASLREGDYDVCVDSTLADGSITYGESVVPGESEDEVLLSTYVCHPSLCNDNLSGVVLLATLGKYLRGMPLRYTVRLLFSPGTIGPLAWLARNEERLGRVKHGLVVSCVGDPGGFTYKTSRRGDAEIDRAVINALVGGEWFDVADWEPLGGDERQFGSPGFDLPVGALSRTPADRFPEYHSSADDLDFVRPHALGGAFAALLSVLDVLEGNATYANLNPKGEPQLGRRGLYRSVGGGSLTEGALLWVLNLSDGGHSLLDISDRSGIPFREIRVAADRLLQHDLLAEA
jgi:aminopeptidase-like protein